MSMGWSDRGFRLLNATHRAVFLRSGGRIGGRLVGSTVVMLQATGRRTGQPRRTMLTAPTATSDRVVLIASKGGDDRHPAWLLNLRTRPDVEVTLHGRTVPARARVLAGAERDRVWAQTVAAHPRYARYQARTSRQIPVVVLTPAPAGRRFPTSDRVGSRP